MLRAFPIPKDVWIHILMEYLDPNALNQFYNTARFIQEFYENNFIWRKRIERFGYPVFSTYNYRFLFACLLVSQIKSSTIVLSTSKDDSVRLKMIDKSTVHRRLQFYINTTDIKILLNHLKILGWMSSNIGDVSIFADIPETRSLNVVYIIYQLLSLGYTKLDHTIFVCRVCGDLYPLFVEPGTKNYFCDTICQAEFYNP